MTWPTSLFVYGTLLAQSQHEMGRLLQTHARQIAAGSIQARLYLITEEDAQGINQYPGAVPSAYPQDRVHGMLFNVLNPEVIFPAFNDFEACTPGWPEPYEFELRPIDVLLDNGETQRAASYLYTWDTSRAELIANGRFERVFRETR